MLRALLELLGRHATLVLAGGVILGLALPQVAELARPFLLPGSVAPLTIALLRLDWNILARYGWRVGLLGLALAWLLVVVPTLMAFVTAPLGLPDGLRAGLVLMAASSPIFSAVAFSLILGLDAALCVVVIVATTALVPFTLPAVAILLLDLKMEIGATELSLRLLAIVGTCFVAAALGRRFISRAWIVERTRLLDGVMVACLLLFGLAIMAGKTQVMYDRTGFFFLVIVAAFIANLALQAISAMVFTRLGRQRSLSVGLMTGNRNMGLVLVAMGAQADFDIEVFFALAQIPVFVLPAVLLPIYRYLMQRERPPA